MTHLGNIALLELPKWGFLASSSVSSGEIMPCYDWATRRVADGDCVVSGFSSKMERDVLHFLLKGGSPVIVVLARAMYKEIPHEWLRALDENKMLIISTSNALRQSRQTAHARNQYVADVSDRLYLVGNVENSSLMHVSQMYPMKCHLINET